MDQLLVTVRGGNTVDLENLQPGDINFEDIFDTLSRKGRYNDNSDRKVSVLDHSILAYTLAFAAKEPEEIQLAALIHDAGEAFIGDIPSPVKYSPYVRGVEVIEGKIDKAIFETAFGVKPINVKSLMQIVKFYDKLALTLEVPYAWKNVAPIWREWIFSESQMASMNFNNEPSLDNLFGARRKTKIATAMNLMRIFWNTKIELTRGRF